MPFSNPPPDLLGLIVAFVVSLVSGFISIARRVLKGHPATLLWVVSEFMTAILCGYLMYEAYPKLSQAMPEFITLPIAVALAAHTGGRLFQEVETAIILKWSSYFTDRRDPPEPPMV